MMGQHKWSIATLTVSVIALGLAIMSHVVFGNTADLPEPPPEPESALTFKIKSFSVTIGRGKKSAAAANDEDDVTSQHQGTGESHRSLKDNSLIIPSICCSLLGLLVGPIAWVREQQPILSGTAMSICCVALLWQYLILGVVAGIALGIIVVIVSKLG